MCMNLLFQTRCVRKERERIDTSVKVFGQTGMGYFTVGNVEVIGSRKDGSEFPAKLSISPMKLGEKWNAVGVVRDITLKKRKSRNLGKQNNVTTLYLTRHP